MACCAMMSYTLDYTCDDHPNPHDCPDIVVIKTAAGYGLPIRDGGSSFIAIMHCPWCGTTLSHV